MQHLCKSAIHNSERPAGNERDVCNWNIGSTIVGSYYIAFGIPYPFEYVNGVYSSIPDAVGARQSEMVSISGNTGLGWYEDHSTLQHYWYTRSGGVNSIVTDFSPPYGLDASLTGISGNNLIGYTNGGGSNYYGLFYDGSTTVDLIEHAGTDTYALGVDGTNVVGEILVAGPATQSFLYNARTFTPLIDPLAYGETIARGISGANIVGDYTDMTTEHGFIINATRWTTYDVPVAEAVQTEIQGISGNTIYGQYFTHNSQLYGFVDTLNLSPSSTPEPGNVATLIGITITAGLAIQRRRIR